MPVKANIRITANEFILGWVLEEVDGYYAELTQFVPTGEQLIPCFWIKKEDLSRVESALQNHSRIADVTKYDEQAGRGLYQIEWNQPHDDFLTVLQSNDILVTEARGTPEAWKFELMASDRNALATFQSACNENEIPITIQSIFQPDLTSVGRVGLTEKQREMLRTAHEYGYFSVPREITVTELGEEFDISPQAASKLLRRGLSTVVEQVLVNT